MSFLQDMGIQVWRLRGRKPRTSRAHVDPTTESVVSTEGSLSAFTDGAMPAEGFSQIGGSSVQSAREVGSLTESPASADRYNLVDRLASESTPKSIAPLPSERKSEAAADGITIPLLRPAPVPLDVAPEIDLSMDTPVDEQPSVAPEYSDFDIPPPDAVEYDGFDVIHEGVPDDQNSRLSIAPLEPLNSANVALSIGELSDLDWRGLQTRISGQQDCPSCGQDQSILGCGDALADWMFIADAPTSNEIVAQQLLQERPGQLYEAMLRACGLTRESVYTSTVFKCSPPEDLSLSPRCDKLIHRQIELVQPKVIVAFGEFPAQSVLRSNEPLSALLNARRSYPMPNSGSDALVITSHSPQQLLADPALKAQSWRALKAVLLATHSA